MHDTSFVEEGYPIRHDTAEKIYMVAHDEKRMSSLSHAPDPLREVSDRIDVEPRVDLVEEDAPRREELHLEDFELAALPSGKSCEVAVEYGRIEPEPLDHRRDESPKNKR